MAESELLKYARARDDANFRWRIAAAMMLKAQAEALWTLPPAEGQLRDWVLQNPMESIERMIAFVGTNPTIAENITVENGVVNTDAVPDADIVFTVNAVWPQVAGSMFPEVEDTGNNSGGAAT